MHKSSTVPLQELLRDAGVTQREFSQAIGVREETVTRWVGGQVPDGRNILAIIAFFEARKIAVRAEQLFEGAA